MRRSLVLATTALIGAVASRSFYDDLFDDVMRSVERFKIEFRKSKLLNSFPRCIATEQPHGGVKPREFDRPLQAAGTYG